MGGKGIETLGRKTSPAKLYCVKFEYDEEIDLWPWALPFFRLPLSINITTIFVSITLLVIHFHGAMSQWKGERRQRFAYCLARIFLFHSFHIYHFPVISLYFAALESLMLCLYDKAMEKFTEVLSRHAFLYAHVLRLTQFNGPKRLTSVNFQLFIYYFLFSLILYLIHFLFQHCCIIILFCQFPTGVTFIVLYSHKLRIHNIYKNRRFFFKSASSHRKDYNCWIDSNYNNDSIKKLLALCYVWVEFDSELKILTSECIELQALKIFEVMISNLFDIADFELELATKYNTVFPFSTIVPFASGNIFLFWNPKIQVAVFFLKIEWKSNRASTAFSHACTNKILAFRAIAFSFRISGIFAKLKNCFENLAPRSYGFRSFLL